MVDVLGAIQNAISIVQKLRTVAKKIEHAELNTLLADLSNELADARMEAAELKTKLAEALSEKEELRGRLDTRSSATPVLDGKVYRFEGEEGRFCTGCFDGRQKKSRVTKLPKGFRSSIGTWECPICKATY